MAMIECPECGSFISDRAYTCPQCGCPISYEDEEPQKPAKRRFGIKSIVICVVLFFASFSMGRSLFPNAIHNEGASFVPIALAILSGIFVVCGLTMAMWKRILLGFIPHFFFYYMILLSMSGGYLLGCIMGM